MEKPWRNRDDEFADTLATRHELIAYWEAGWRQLFDSLANLTPDDLGKTVTIRGEPHSVPLAMHSLAHCAYHVGQIILIARILAGISGRRSPSLAVLLPALTSRFGERATIRCRSATRVAVGDNMSVA